MSKSNFVMEKMCVDTILKVENLKKALNGNFKADVEEKSVEKSKNERDIKRVESKKGFEVSLRDKAYYERRKNLKIVNTVSSGNRSRIERYLNF